MKLVIKAGRACGTVAAPPSKSAAHRLLLGAALAAGESRIHGITDSADMRATLACLPSLGAFAMRCGVEQTIAPGIYPTARKNGRKTRTPGETLPALRENGEKIHASREISPDAVGFDDGAAEIPERDKNGGGCAEKQPEIHADGGCGGSGRVGGISPDAVGFDDGAAEISARGKSDSAEIAPGEISTDVIVRGGGELPSVRWFPCGESGSTLRFCIPLALTGGKAVFEGTERLLARGIGVYEELFAKRNISVEKTAKRITLEGILPSGYYEIPGNVSSQFATGLLFALPRLPGMCCLTIRPPVESRPYIDLTLDILRRFGVWIMEVEPNRFLIPGGQSYLPGEHTVEGDWSNAAPLLALGVLGGKVRVTGLNPVSRQGDRVFPDLAEQLLEPGSAIDVSACPDLAPVLFALAALQRGGTFVGTARLRLKESDRAAAMATELAKCGVAVTVEENRVIVPGGAHAPASPFDAHNDHRVVMALSLIAARFGGVIEGAEALNKSYPAFADDLRRLGLEVRYEI